MSRRSSKYQNSSALRKSNSVTNHRVSYSAVSAYGGDTKRAPKIDGNKITYVPYNAGGGSGSENLTREALQKEQFEMFKRTITLCPSIIANVDQECRQLTVVEKFKTIVVNIAREDFPHINADIEVKFLPSTAQASWRNFMRDMMVTLDLQFIDGIIEKETRLPVFCILSLTDKGNYYVRQREESAVLEAIYSGTTPTQPTWPIIDEINAVTDDLNFHCSHKSVMRERVTALISKPVVRKQQMDATSIILKAMDPDTILAAVHDVMNINMHELEQQALRKKEARAAAKAKRKKGTLSDTEALDDASRPGSPDVTEIKTETAVDPNKPKYDTEVDVVTIHRHALESLSRLATLKEKESINNIADLPEQPPLSEDVVIATEKGEKENPIEIITPSAAGVDPNAPVPVDENKINIPIHLQKIIAKPVIDFIDDTISNYRDEADIVITALKLLNDLCPHLAADEFKDQILDIIVDTMQAYAPNPPPDRPRAPKRYLIKLDEKLRQEKEAEELRLAIEAEKIRKEAAKAARRKARGLSDKDPTRKRREAGVGADDLLSEKRMQPKSDSEGEDDYLAPAVATRKKPPRKRAEEPVAEEPSATAPVVAAWRGSVGDTNAGDKLRKRLKDVEEAMRKKPLTKEERIRQKFYKMKTKPLPVTQGVKFRGLAGKLRKETTFIQSCGTLFKFLHTHYCYRADCFRFCVHEEIAELAHSCQAIPPVLEYLMWSLNDLYSDGYARDDSGGDIYGVNNYEFGPGIGNVKAEEHRHTNAQDDQGTLYSIGLGDVKDDLMQTSRYGDESSTGTGGNESIDPNTGKVINAVSSITGVSMDLERGLVYENTEVPNQVYYGGKELVPKLRDGLQFNGDLFNAIDLTAKLDDEEAKRQKRLAKQMRAKEILRLKEARELAKQTGAVLTDDMSISSETSSREGEPSLQTFGIATAEVAAANVSIVRPTSGTNRRSDDASNKKSKELKKRLHQPEPGDFVFPSECNEYTEGFQNPELDMNGESVAPSVMAIAPSGKPLGSLGLKVNTEVKYHLGEEIFKSRFATLPCDDIIVAWAFIANHDELQARERDMALMWLNVWDDNSRHYKMLKKKGFNMATM